MMKHGKIMKGTGRPIGEDIAFPLNCQLITVRSIEEKIPSMLLMKPERSRRIRQRMMHKLLT